MNFDRSLHHTGLDWRKCETCKVDLPIPYVLTEQGHAYLAVLRAMEAVGEQDGAAQPGSE